MKKMGAGIDEWQLVNILLDGLGERYRSFESRLIVSMTSTPDFDQMVDLLFEETRMIQARGEDTAMAAAMKRYEKEKDDKASASRSTTPSGRGGRGGRNPSRGGNNNSKTKPRHSNNPNDHRNVINLRKMQMAISRSIGHMIPGLYMRTGYLKNYAIARQKRIQLPNGRIISWIATAHISRHMPR